MGRRELPRWAPAALLGTLAFLVYIPSLGNGFALDDVPAVAQDTRIRDLGNIPELVTAPYLTYMPVARSPYRPVTSVSYAVSWALGSGHPAAFHAVNVLLHVGATLLLLSVLTALGAAPPVAALATGVFAVHPVHVEAVAGVVGRADVIAALFCLVAVRLHLARGLPSGIRIPAVALAYLLGLGAKESAVVLPVLILLVDATGRMREDMAVAGGSEADVANGPVTLSPDPGLLSRLLGSWRTHAALAGALAIYLTIRSAVLGGVVQMDIAAYIVALPTSLRVTTAIANLAEVARLLVFPLDLSPEYGPAVIVPSGLSDTRFWAGVVVAATALLLAFRGARLGREGAWLALGVAWTAVGFALVSNVVLPMPMWLAERTLYLSSIGVSLLLVGAIGRAPRAGAAVAVAFCVLGAAHTWERSSVWRSDEALFGDLVERHPESFRAQWWLGGRMVDAGDVEGGLVWLGRAVDNSPNSVLVSLDYARALLLTGRSAEAEAIVRPIPPALHPSRAVFLAQSLIFQGRDGEAADVVREGLALFPDEPRLTEQARVLGIGGG